MILQIEQYCISRGANTHRRTICLVTRITQTIKYQQACIKQAAKSNCSLGVSSSITYQQRIGRQNILNIAPFEAHFDGKLNTPLGNLTTILGPKKIISINFWLNI